MSEGFHMRIPAGSHPVSRPMDDDVGVMEGVLSRLCTAFALLVIFATASCSAASSGSSITAQPSGSTSRIKEFGGLAMNECEVADNLTTLEAASAQAGYQLLAPHDVLADSSPGGSLTGIWQCGGREFEMHFTSGIVVLQEANSIGDPARAWQRLANQDSVDTLVGTVQGEPAALIDPAKSKGGALGSVTVVLGGTIMWVVGDGTLSISDLVRVADSLRPV